MDVPLVEVDIGLLADQVGVAAADTLYLGQSVHDLDFAINLYCVRQRPGRCPILSSFAIRISIPSAPPNLMSLHTIQARRADVRWC